MQQGPAARFSLIAPRYRKRALSPLYHAAFTNDPRSIVLARSAIVSFARLCGFGQAEAADIQTASGEALLNASQYGRRGPHGGGFSVHCSFEHGELRIEIQDSGRGFDSGRAGGFGTIIMRTLMNDISYSHGGTRVRLIKRLEAGG